MPWVTIVLFFCVALCLFVVVLLSMGILFSHYVNFKFSLMTETWFQRHELDIYRWLRHAYTRIHVLKWRRVQESQRERERKKDKLRAYWTNMHGNWMIVNWARKMYTSNVHPETKSYLPIAINGFYSDAPFSFSFSVSIELFSSGCDRYFSCKFHLPHFFLCSTLFLFLYLFVLPFFLLYLYTKFVLRTLLFKWSEFVFRMFATVNSEKI